MESNNNDRDKVIADFFETTRNIEARSHEISLGFSKHLVTLTAGAIVLTVTFARVLTPTPIAGSSWLLFTGWGCLFLTLIVTLLTLIVHERANRVSQDILVDVTIRFLEGGKPDPYTRINHLYKIGSYLHYASLVLFTLGLGFLMSFAVLNYFPNQGPGPMRPPGPILSPTPTPSARLSPGPIPSPTQTPTLVLTPNPTP